MCNRYFLSSDRGMKLTDEELDERFVTEISMIIEREIAKEKENFFSKG